jgi:hypothetical protein
MAEDLIPLEWMVNSALARYLRASSERPERKEWFFGLHVETMEGKITIGDLCGFSWSSEEVDWKHDRGLGEYRRIRPDFRFWKNDKSMQLIIEGKDEKKPKETLIKL